MSWLFSRALVEEFSVGACLDGERSVQLSATHTPPASCLSVRTMEAWSLSPCGTTYAPSTEDHGEVLLMSFRAASPARTSATPGTRSELKASVPASGERWPALLARFDHDSSSWRTSQRCLVEGWARFSETWPAWGFMRDGECLELPMSVDTNLERGFGLWPTLKALDGDQYSKNFDYFKRRRLVAPDLPVIVGLSTPPTPMGFYGRLNPDWCEWLMGWPVGWTESGSRATDKTREWLQQHGESSPLTLCKEAA